MSLSVRLNCKSLRYSLHRVGGVVATLAITATAEETIERGGLGPWTRMWLLWVEMWVRVA